MLTPHEATHGFLMALTLAQGTNVHEVGKRVGLALNEVPGILNLDIEYLGEVDVYAEELEGKEPN